MIILLFVTSNEKIKYKIQECVSVQTLQFNVCHLSKINTNFLFQNFLPCFTSYNFFQSKHSTTIYWIRQLCVFLNFRLVYFSHIKEIQLTKTYHRVNKTLDFIYIYYICFYIILIIVIFLGTVLF